MTIEPPKISSSHHSCEVEGENTTSGNLSRKADLKSSSSANISKWYYPIARVKKFDLAMYGLTLDVLKTYREYALNHRITKNVTAGVYPRLPKEETKLRHTITAMDDNSVVVHIKRKKTDRSGFINKGTSKKVYELLRFYENEKIEQGADLTIFRNLDGIRNEHGRASRLVASGCLYTAEPGIILHSYSTKKNIVGASRFCIIMPLHRHLIEFFGSKSNSYSKLKLIYGAVKGVAEMHSQKPPMIHRDIKLENFLVATVYEKGMKYLVTKICDFGQATTIPHRTYPQGNIGHWPPEIFQERHRTTGRIFQNEKGDVWALGVLLHTLFFSQDADYDYPQFIYDMADWKMCSQIIIDNFLNELRKAHSNHPIHSKVIDWISKCLRYEQTERISAAELGEEIKVFIEEINPFPGISPFPASFDKP